MREILHYHPAATVYIADSKLYLNLKAQEITGYMDSDFESVDDWFRAVFRDDAVLARGFYQHVRDSGFPSVDRFEIFRKDGKKRILDFKGSLIGEIEIWSLTDVTDMLLTEERFSVLFNQSTEPHLIFDETGMIDCNEAMVKLLNASSKKQLMSVHPAVYSPERQPCGQLSREKRQQMDELALKNGSHQFEWVLKKIDGEEFHVEVTVSSVTLAGKKIFLSVVHDLTQAKETQAKILASAKMATLGEMASNIAHEINNPLAIIYAFTHKIRKQVNSESINKEDVLKGVEKINTTVNRISKIIKGLRFFARETDNVSFEDLDIKSVVMDTLDICHEKMRNNGVQVEVNITEGCLVNGQAVQISQVIMNLMSNSFDAVSACPEKWIRVTSELDREWVRIRFSDSGSGIPEHVVENMMKPFFSTKEVGKGTGLGLSISKGIVESHGGRFIYEKHLGHTSFIVELPLKIESKLKAA